MWIIESNGDKYNCNVHYGNKSINFISKDKNKLNDEALKDVNAGTQKITSGDFLIEDGVVAGEGAKTIVTSIGYNSNIKATVNGKSADCFEYFGKTAVSLGDVSGDIKVSISSGLDGLGLGLALFISGLTVVISYTIYYFRLSGGKDNA